MDANGVLERAWDATNNQLRLVAAGTATTPPKNHDANSIWDAVFDKATSSIRVVRVP